MQNLRAWAGYAETWILVALLAGRVALAASLGLGRDEAAYWYWAWNGLDASYSLVTATLLRISTFLFGDAPTAQRLPVVLAGWVAAVLVVRVCRRLGAGRRAALFGGIAVAGAPVVSYAGSLVHSDSFLILLVVLFAERTLAVTQAGPGRGRLPAMAGVAALATFTKLTGALFLVPALWIVWRNRGARGAASLAALIIIAAGVLLAVALDPQTVAGVREFGRFPSHVSPAGRVALVGLELVIWAGPALLAVAAAGAWMLGRPEARNAWPAWVAVALLLIFHIGFALTGQAKANWFLPALILLLPPGVVFWEQRNKLAAARWLAVASVAVTVGQATALLLPARPLLWQSLVASPWSTRVASTYSAHVGPREQVVSPSRTWVDRAEEYHDRVGDDPRIAAASVIASEDYGLAFRAAHALGRATRVCLPWDPVFAPTCGDDPAPGESVLFVSYTMEPPAEWAAHFREVTELDPVAGCLKNLRVWSCRNWHGEDDESLVSHSKRNPMTQAARNTRVRLDLVQVCKSVAAFAIAGAAAFSATPARANADGAQDFDHSGFNALLAEYVETSGVRYADWSVHKEHREALEIYVTRLAAATPNRFHRDQQLAFWLNAYNALTLDLVLEHYPVRSIKDIDSPWKKKIVTIEGVQLSLNDIENEIIRKNWDEPRIHFALNCASISCPPLRAEAYSGPMLDVQLEEQTVAFLANEAFNFVDEKGRLHLSKIFRWYEDDFKNNEQSIVDWVRPYMPALQELDPSRRVRIKHGGYDWNLNEATSDSNR